MIRALKDFFWAFTRNVLGIKIVRVNKRPFNTKKPFSKMEYVHDPAFSHMQDPIYLDLLIEELAHRADKFLQLDLIPLHSDSSTYDIVRDFFDIYSNRELTDNSRGSGFHNAFWLYVIARAMNPELIVESGVWKGHSSWLLHQACPEARLFGFDIKLNKFEFPKMRSMMHQQDWGSFDFPDFDPEKALVFFDCHVNHALRLLEAKEKGFKHLLLDDNPPVHKIYSHIPGIPTAAMLAENQGIDQEEISWTWNKKLVTREIDIQQAQQARQLIKYHHILEDVGGPTRYGGFAFLTYVQI